SVPDRHLKISWIFSDDFSRAWAALPLLPSNPRAWTVACAPGTPSLSHPDQGFKIVGRQTGKRHVEGEAVRWQSRTHGLLDTGPSGGLMRVNSIFGAPYGTRTRVTAVKGRRPRPLDEGR